MTQTTTNREAEAQTRGLLTIQRVVADHYKLPIAAMTSKKRTAEYANARHVAMFLARSLLGASFPDIAAAFGKKDHMSAMHGFRAVSDKMPHASAFVDEVVALRNSARLQLSKK
jgi:chromosomal replication initiator protein